MSVTQNIAEEVCATRYEDLPLNIVDILKNALLDDLGIAFFGYQQVHKSLAEYANTLGGTPESTVIGAGYKVNCALAACVNTQMASDTDFDEAGPGGHPLSPMAKTAIAVGERTGASGKDILAAIAITYDLSGRFSRSIKGPRNIFLMFPKEERRHLTLNAAICSAKILGLSAEEINRAMGLAWLTYVPPSMDYSIGNIGGDHRSRLRPNFWSSQLGIQASLLTHMCGLGPLDILDRRGADIYDLSILLRSPEPFYAVSRELCLKPWIGSQGFMGGIGLIGELLRKNKIKPDDIVQVIFTAGDDYAKDPIVTAAGAPRDFWQAVNNIPWSTANTILGYEPGPDWAGKEAMSDAKRINMAKKVKVVGGEPHTNAVEIITQNQSYKASVPWDNFPGSPKNRFSQERIEAKFIRLATPVVGERHARKIVNVYRHLEELDDVKKLSRYFAPAK